MNAYKQALDSQGACNLSGLANGLAVITDELWKEARAEGKGTDYVNLHPVVRLFLEQMVYLNGGAIVDGKGAKGYGYCEAHQICEEKAR